MIIKKVIALLIILILGVAAGFLLSNYYQKSATTNNQSIQIQDQQINDNTKPFKITITYPQIVGLDDFNQEVKSLIDKEISDFKTNSLENDTAIKETDPENYNLYPREYDLIISYAKGEASNDIVSVVFDISNYTGGAHGAHYFRSVNYNPVTKAEITLADLFPGQTDYLQKISDFAKQDLTKQITERAGSTDGSWVDDGASPKPENYFVFLINKDNIIFYFPQYQVAAYALGDFQVIYPR